MSEAKSLLDHYRYLLPMARATATEKGTIRAVLPDGNTQTHIVRGRQVVLPTKEFIEAENGSELMFFHPFLEDGGKRVTESVDDYRSRVAVTIGLGAIAAMSNLSQLASSEKHSPALNTQQIKALVALKDLDKNAHRQIMEVFNNVIADPDYRKSHWPIKMFISGRGETSREANTSNFNYWTTVSFPLYDEILDEMRSDTPKEGRRFAGVKISNKALTCLKNLFEYMFQHVAEDNWYSSGSDCDVAPFMISLLKSMQELTDSINSVIQIFDTQVGFSDLLLPTEWIDSIAAIPRLHKQIVSISVGNSFARERVESKEKDEISVNTRTEVTKPRTIETVRKEAKAEQTSSEVPEFIRTPRGLVRNPEYRRKVAIGSFGSLSRRNAYDPTSSDAIVPDSAVFNINSSIGNGAWSR